MVDPNEPDYEKMDEIALDIALTQTNCGIPDEPEISIRKLRYAIHIYNLAAYRHEQRKKNVKSA